MEKIDQYFNFYRESNNFDDILNDKNIKKLIHSKTKWAKHLRISVTNSDSVYSYIILKYGDDLIYKNLTKDFTPIPNRDYAVKKSFYNNRGQKKITC